MLLATIGSRTKSRNALRNNADAKSAAASRLAGAVREPIAATASPTPAASLAPGLEFTLSARASTRRRSQATADCPLLPHRRLDDADHIALGVLYPRVATDVGDVQDFSNEPAA